MPIRYIILVVLALSSATLARAADADGISGVVAEAFTGKPVSNAVVHLTWIAHPQSAERGSVDSVLVSSRLAFSLELVTDRAGQFQAKRPKLNLPSGFELTRDLDPAITIYATGYRRASFTGTALATRHTGSSEAASGLRNTLLIEPLSNEQDQVFALERDIGLWRQDIDQRRDPGNWVSAEVMHHSTQKKLIALFKRICADARSEESVASCSLGGSHAPQLVAQPSEHAPSRGSSAADVAEPPSTIVTIGTASQPSVHEIDTSPSEPRK